MSERTQYFKKFPITVYNGQPVINILRRVDFNENVKNYLTSFYSYTLSTDDRIENIAFEYYDDVDLDWILYHANDIIDPRFDVPLSYGSFDEFINKKYGSKRRALREVLYYKNNYEGDDQILSVGGYNSLSANIKKYYSPVNNALGIVGYERAKLDFIASTNKMLSLTLNDINGNFIKDEVIFKNNDTTNIAQICFISFNAIDEQVTTIQHVQGNFLSNTNYTITGETSGATANVVASEVKLLFNTIPEDEQVFYKPITVFEHEEKLNEQKRNIYLIDNGYKDALNKQLTDIMK
jgi:hypothetical protein